MYHSFDFGRMRRSSRVLGNPKTFFRANLKDLSSPAAAQRKLPDMTGMKFGTCFSPRMLEVDWTKADGWGDPVIKDYQNISIPPFCGAIQHGLQCFEGLKAYMDPAGKIRLFRPEMNAKRLLNSFTRLQFPQFDVDEFCKCLVELVRLDKAFVPAQANHSLYIRPAGIATSPSITPSAPEGIKLFIMTSPVGPYYAGGFKPVKLMVEQNHHRAWPGGHGAFKVGPNYAGVVGHQLTHGKKGYSQILWLGPDGVVDEVGAMNFLMLWKTKSGERELITAPLDGTILPGVTRDSILTMAREWDEFKVSEKRFTMTDVVEAFREKRVEEMFGCGTAAIVTTVESIAYQGEEFVVPTPENGVAMRCMKSITDIQTGRAGEHPWSIIVEGT